MNFLSLNCQKGYHPGLRDFLESKLKEEVYDVLILQEVTDQVLSYLQYPSYRCVRAFSEELGKENELCIVYKKSFNLLRQGFKSFASMRKDPARGFKHPAFGILWVDLEINNDSLRIASIHTHSGIDSKIRLKEVKLAKEILSNELVLPTIITGDFNAGFSSEPSKIADILAPEFTWISEKLGSTLDSRYSENVAHLTNRIAAFLALFNVGIRLHTDHVFIDSNTMKKQTAICQVLPNRVSDHSPIECTVNPI